MAQLALAGTRLLDEVRAEAKHGYWGKSNFNHIRIESLLIAFESHVTISNQFECLIKLLAKSKFTTKFLIP